MKYEAVVFVGGLDVDSDVWIECCWFLAPWGYLEAVYLTSHLACLVVFAACELLELRHVLLERFGQGVFRRLIRLD